jgi:hypothetical protein
MTLLARRGALQGPSSYEVGSALTRYSEGTCTLLPCARPTTSNMDIALGGCWRSTGAEDIMVDNIIKTFCGTADALGRSYNDVLSSGTAEYYAGQRN